MRRLARAVTLLGLLLAPVALGACGDRSGSPSQMLGTGGSADRGEGLEARLTAEPAEADSGETVLVRARLRPSGDTPLVPTAFLASVRYDTAPVEVLEAVAPERTTEPALRAVNPAAAPDLVRAAGAAPDGFATTVLFAVRARVHGPGWRQSLALELDELYVTADSVGEASGRVPVAADVVPEASVGDGSGRGGASGSVGTGSRRRDRGGGFPGGTGGRRR